MSNDQYEHKNYWNESPAICVEKDKEGNCLMSYSFIIIDMGQLDDKPKLFCKELKTNKNDKIT